MCTLENGKAKGIDGKFQKLEMTDIRDKSIGNNKNSLWISSVTDVIEGKGSRVVQSPYMEWFTAPNSALKSRRRLEFLFQFIAPAGLLYSAGCYLLPPLYFEFIDSLPYLLSIS